MGPAIRRAERPAATSATSSKRPRIVATGTSPRCSWRPSTPEMAATARALARNVIPKNAKTMRPTRRRKCRRAPLHGPGPRGGNGSFSGHHGGRNPGPRRNCRPSHGRSGIGEPVADAVHGEHVPRASRGWFDLPADVLHVCVDGPLVGFEGHAVNRVEQLAASEHPAGLADERGQELELRRSEIDGALADPDPYPLQIDLDVGSAKNLWSGDSP